MQISIANFSDIPTFDLRFDPEFYEPKNLKLEALLKRHNSVPLGNLCYLHDGPFGSELLSSSYSNDGVPALRMQNVSKDGLPLLGNVEFITEDEADRLHKHIAFAGEVVTTKIGFLGYSTVLPNLYERYFFRRELTRLVIKEYVKLRPQYLAAFLNTSYGRNQALRYSTGTTRDRVLLVNQRHMLVPVFSESFQKSVEETITKAQKGIEHSTEHFNEAEKILLTELNLINWQPKHQLTFVKKYSDTEQAGRIDAEYYQPKYEDIIKAIKAYKGGWDTLGNLVTVKKSVEVGSGEYLDEGIPFVRVSNLSPFEITEEKYISGKLYQEIKQHQPKKGEMLFSKDATPGIAYYLNEIPKKMIPSGGILRLKNKSGRINSEYLTLVLNSILTKEQINRDVGGSVILHWRPDQVKETVIPIITEEKQTEIQQKVIESFNLRKKSKHLLECAKRAVEIAIEQDEQTAINWLENETIEMQI